MSKYIHVTRYLSTIYGNEYNYTKPVHKALFTGFTKYTLAGILANPYESQPLRAYRYSIDGKLTSIVVNDPDRPAATYVGHLFTTSAKISVSQSHFIISPSWVNWSATYNRV